jgi:hypothetical protein
LCPKNFYSFWIKLFNIEFEKKWPDLHNRLQEEIFLKGVLLGKNQNLSNQLDSLKDIYSRHIDYVKLINKKVGTGNSGKEFSEITENTNKAIRFLPVNFLFDNNTLIVLLESLGSC